MGNQLIADSIALMLVLDTMLYRLLRHSGWL
jgi:hypothetical protein